VFIEGYVDPRHTHLAPGERFAEVTFDLDGDVLHSPRWRHKERADVERLIGGPVGVPVESSYFDPAVGHIVTDEPNDYRQAPMIKSAHS